MLPRQREILEQRFLDGLVAADRIVGIAPEQHELPVGERPAAVDSVDPGQRKLPHQLQRRSRLHDAFEPCFVPQGAEEAQEIELPVPHQRERRRNAARREDRVGVGEEQVFGIRRAAGSGDARVHCMDLAGPVVRAGVDLDDLEAFVTADLGPGDGRRVVGAAIEREHIADMPIILGPQ